MLFSEVNGRKVVSTGNAATVGKLKSLVVDAAAQRVVALRLTKTSGSGTVLRWPDIHAVGADAITVTGDEKVVEPDAEIIELDGKAHTLVGKQVLNTAGHRLGSVVDVDFDPADGRITSVLMQDHAVDGSTLLGVGSFAVIVKA